MCWPFCMLYVCIGCLCAAEAAMKNEKAQRNGPTYFSCLDQSYRRQDHQEKNKGLISSNSFQSGSSVTHWNEQLTPKNTSIPAQWSVFLV